MTRSRMPEPQSAAAYLAAPSATAAPPGTAFPPMVPTPVAAGAQFGAGQATGSVAVKEPAGKSTSATERPARSAGKARADRRASRRRTRRIVLVAAGAGVVAAAAAGYELMPGGGGPSHVISTPEQVGAYTQAPALAASMQAASLRSSIMSESGGDASHVVDAVYEDSSGTAAKSGQQIVLFIGGNRSGSSPSAFIASFTGNLQGAVTTSPGSLGGAAACVPSVSGRPAECAWADDDTFGLVASPTLGAQALANELRQLRPQVEHLAK